MMNEEDNGNSTSDEPHIIVDEGWKAQVEREKETLRNQNASGDDASSAEELLPPPASFEGLINMLASQAMASLGFMVDPETGEPSVNRPVAKYLIDLLGVVEEKTKGNLLAEEEMQLQDALHSMRMLYVEVARQSGPASGNGVQAEPQAKKPIIELP